MPTKEYKVNHSLRPGGGGDPDRVFRSTDRSIGIPANAVRLSTDGRTEDTNGFKYNEFHFAPSFASVERDRVAKSESTPVGRPGKRKNPKRVRAPPID